VELINAGDMSMVIPNDPKVRLRAIREFRLGDASPKPIDGTTGPSPIEAASAASVRQTFASIGAEVPEVRYLYTRKIVYGKTACYSTQFYLNPNSKNPKDLGLGTTPGPELEEFVKKQPP
jgi:hypothetical protein